MVAEGVEDVHTLRLLQELGCDLVQGYHVSRPTSPTRISALVRAGAAERPRLRAVAPARVPAPAVAT